MSIIPAPPRRYTPTHVGTLKDLVYQRSSLSVHPHARGDISNLLLVHSINSGTPPRTWGHCDEQKRAEMMMRYTPTHVGTFRLAPSASSALPVHPHARGDIVEKLELSGWTGGTPPRTWGH